MAENVSGHRVDIAPEQQHTDATYVDVVCKDCWWTHTGVRWPDESAMDVLARMQAEHDKTTVAPLPDFEDLDDIERWLNA